MYFFFFNDTATTEIYTLSLHDALPISVSDRSPARQSGVSRFGKRGRLRSRQLLPGVSQRDRKSTRLNSSHGYISYAVFCLKKKKKNALELPAVAEKSSLDTQRSCLLPR